MWMGQWHIKCDLVAGPVEEVLRPHIWAALLKTLAMSELFIVTG